MPSSTMNFTTASSNGGTWNSPENALTSNSLSTTATGSPETPMLVLGGATNVSPSVEINGFLVEISFSGQFTVTHCALRKTGVPGSDQSAGEGPAVYAQIGSPTNLFGHTWSGGESLGLELIFTDDSSGHTCSVEHVRLTVYYDNPDIWDETASGGLVGGSTALVNTNFQPRGGVVGSSSATNNVVYNATVVGGVVAGGQAITDKIRITNIGTELLGDSTIPIRITSLGVELLGSAYYSNIGSGGILAGGTSPNFVIRQNTASGGAVLAGLTPNEIIIAAHGGAVLAGLASNTVFNAAVATGGAVLAGLSNVSLAYIARGGAVAGGTSVVQTADKVGRGGIVAGGAANDSLAYISQGGAVAGGTAVVQTTDKVGRGGIVAGGTAFSYIDLTAKGGAVAGGLADVAGNILGRGGIVAGGTAALVIDLTGSGGGVCDGIADLSTEDKVARGGAVVGGLAVLSSSQTITSLGGAVTGGQSLVSLINSSDTISGGAVVGGTAFLPLALSYEATGGITVGGSSTPHFRLYFVSSGNSGDAPPNFSGVTVGYLNEQNPTIVRTSWELEIEVVWHVGRAIIVDTEVVWNTGVLREYFYRVIGKAKEVDVCDPIQVGETCCKKFMMNVHARTVTELCEKLKKRRWKWPIEKVQRFSRPAETAAIAEDEAAGINTDCNVLEDVEICDNPVCAEFCVDFDVKENWGWFDKVQLDAFFHHEATGAVLVGGTSVTNFAFEPDHIYAATGGITMGGQSDFKVPFLAKGGVVVGARSSTADTASSQSSSWYYVGGEWPYIKDSLPIGTDFFVENIGDRVWSNPQNALISDGNSATTDISSSVPSGYLVVKNFKLGVPINHKIIGIEVNIERQASIPAVDAGIYLVVNDEIVSDDMSQVSTWPIGVDGTLTYGGLGNTWRDADDPDYLGDWSLEDINSPEFGVAIRVQASIGSPSAQATVNSVTLKIYYQHVNHHLEVGGESKTKSSNYNWVANPVSSPFVLSGSSIYKKGVRFVSLGKGSMGPSFAGAMIGGSYGLSLFYEATGGLTLTGSSSFGPGGAALGGTASVSSTSNYYTSTGGLTLASDNLVKVHRRYNVVPGVLTLTGEGGVNNEFRHEASGSIVLGGESRVRSSVYNWVSDGNAIFVFGPGADYSFSDIGTLFTNVGFSSTVYDLKLVYPNESTTSNLGLSEDRVTECGCVGMSLSLPFSHNLNVSNKFSQFLTRNNLSFPSTIEMRYNKINDAWIKNLKYVGFGAAIPVRESWTLVFQMSCTKDSGGIALDTQIWRFSMQVVQQNLSTMADYDTHVLVGFKPENTCNGGFRIGMTVNTQLGSVSLLPEATLYEFKLYDNVGLFKSPYWLSNPLLKFELSQTGLDLPVPRIPVTIT